MPTARRWRASRAIPPRCAGSPAPICVPASRNSRWSRSGSLTTQAPDDPKLLQLIGVAEDFAGRHAAAQARYRRGLEFLPGDRGLSVNLALSLALSGHYGEAVAVLSPLALGPAGTPGERQTLALIYALQGDNRAAERIARLDLDAQSATRQLAYYDTLRPLSPEARSRAIRSMSTSPAGARPPST